jgi:hypothetical protein
MNGAGTGGYFLAVSYNTFRCHGVAGNPYFLPNDDEEMIRLDELHFVMQKIYRRNVLAPIRWLDDANILDIGTGSGYSQV